MYWLFSPLVIGVGKAFLLVWSRVVLPEQKSNQQSLHSHTHTQKKGGGILGNLLGCPLAVWPIGEWCLFLFGGV